MTTRRTTACRALILAAGYGTRMLPATKAVPKELLPLVDSPVIEYIVDEVVSSGIHEIVIVTAAGKRAIEDHFDRVPELEQLLQAKGDVERLQRVRRSTSMADIVFVRQHEMGGIAHAVLSARHAIGDQPFVLLLPDDPIVADPPATRQILNVFERQQASVVLVERVPRERIPSYGVIKPRPITEGVFEVEGLVEKPQLDEAPSDLAIVGRYAFTPAIFDAIERTQRGAGGELQITDAMQRLLEQERLYACELRGKRYDIGQPLSYLQAAIELTLNRPEFGPQLRSYLSELMDSKNAPHETESRRG
jgi:UTP--glucose-1-phosphate uridylyltransferase